MTDEPSLRSILAAHPVVPVVTLDDPEDASRLADALIAGGIGIVEITLRSEAGLVAIRNVKASHPGMIVSAGTVLDPDRMAQVVEAGADFVVSPGATPGLLDAAARRGTAYMPGVATASEAMVAAEAGFRVLKFFPAAAAGGPAFLKGIAGPLPHLAFCPTGGVSAANAADYLALSNVLSVGGSWIADRKAIAEGDWKGISARAAAAVMCSAPATTLSARSR